MKRFKNIILAIVIICLAGCGPQARGNAGAGSMPGNEFTESASMEETEDIDKDRDGGTVTENAEAVSEAAKGRTVSADDEQGAQDKGDEEDISLYEAITSESGLGPDAIVGTAIGSSYFNDSKVMNLIHENYNALTLENELKPDSMFNYRNAEYPAGSVHEEELNGEMIKVPTVDHKNADRMLDKILEWNLENPDRPLKVRGHVLVWHSQTPEWFFREDYDINKPYVSKEVMDKRLEWYIKTMLEYYTGEGSRYKGLFYGWDVVNEAVSDAKGSYRTDTEGGSDKLDDPIHSSKSSWWHVYESNEYIINAFRYANKYAAPEVDLYYNDYNECNDLKMKGIINLLSAVKDDPQARIDGFGMQGHYSLSQPSDKKFESCARKYLEVVDKVMITELDVKASSMYDGSEEMAVTEYEKQAEYLSSLYDAAKRIRADGGDFAGIVTWGVVDKYSWLHSFTGKPQCPLLFDDNYERKPAFRAFTK